MLKKVLWKKILRAATVVPMAAIILGQAAHAYTLNKTTHVITVSPTAQSTADLRNLMTFLQGRADKTTQYTVVFNPGKYSLTLPVYSSGMQNVEFKSADAANPGILAKAANFSGSDYMFFHSMCKNIKVTNLQFNGLTTFASNSNPVWGDQGVYFGSCDGVDVEGSKFYNFGNGAFRVTTHNSDPKMGVDSFNTKVINNTFNNFYQISTTSNDNVHGATAHYTLQNNNFYNIRGSVKFASRTPGAIDVHLIGNTLNGGDHYGYEIDNFSNFEIANNNISNIKSVAINIYTNVSAPKGFQWGDNFTIKGNTMKNVGRGVRFSPDPFSDGTRIIPKNLVIDSNTVSGTTETNSYIPAIGVMNGTVSGVTISNNKLSNIAGKNYIMVSSTSTGITKLNNLADGVALGTQSTTTSTSTSGTTTTGGTTATTVPAVPSNLAGQFDGQQTVRLTWTDNATNETSQQVWLAKDGVSFTKLTDVAAGATSYSHNLGSTPTASSYSYTVRSVNAKGASTFAKVAKVALSGGSTTPVATAPATSTSTSTGTATTKPASPSGLAASASSGSVKLTWTDNASNETSEQVWVSTNGSQYTLLSKLSSGATTYSYAPGSGKSFYYTVRSVNSVGTSAFCKPAKVST